MKLSEGLKPVSYFKNDVAAVIRRLNEHQGTMIITQNGEAKAALIDIKA
jgi:prevent-host-death family protein